LKTLQRFDHISPIKTDKTGARPRQLYIITKGGRKLLREWIDQLPYDQPPRNGFLLKVLLMGYGSPGSLLTHVLRHKEKLSERLAGPARVRKSLMVDTFHPDFQSGWLSSVLAGL
jgi:DNA-binding PadR family transcriptional regulator